MAIFRLVLGLAKLNLAPCDPDMEAGMHANGHARSAKRIIILMAYMSTRIHHWVTLFVSAVWLLSSLPPPHVCKEPCVMTAEGCTCMRYAAGSSALKLQNHGDLCYQHATAGSLGVKQSLGLGSTVKGTPPLLRCQDCSSARNCAFSSALEGSLPMCSSFQTLSAWISSTAAARDSPLLAGEAELKCDSVLT